MMKQKTEASLPRRMRRRALLKGLGALGLYGALPRWAPAYAAAGTTGALPPTASDAAAHERVFDLTIDAFPFRVSERIGAAVAVNGSVPGPLVRLREGETAVLRVANRLEEISSIHWHGIILPPDMDGVPGVSFAGIRPGETFVYRFPVRQSGTYWAHSHSGGQELLGLYFPLIIDPKEPEPFQYERDYTVVLSDWSFEKPEAILAKLKRQSGYYNFQRRTVGDFFRDVRKNGWSPTLEERLAWARMRMDPTDFADVSGYTYTYLINGLWPEANWTALFRPGEKVRLRFIDAGAMTYFDVRIPGLKMTVVQADGQNVQPVTVDEFRIAPGETLDVIVEPQGAAYTLFAETMDRSGYARGTLATHAGASAPLPARRARPLRSMLDMGMDVGGDMKGMDMNAGGSAKSATSDMAGMDMGGGAKGAASAGHGAGAAATTGDAMNMAMPGMAAKGLKGPSLPGAPPVEHGPDTHGPGNSSVAMYSHNRMDDPGSGFEGTGSRVLLYTDLQSLQPQPDARAPEREIELHITGNMDRYMWSFDGKKYSEAKTPIALRYGERLRITFVNDTMMEHPMHLHGMWMELENGAGPHQPRKHTVNVKPAERLSVAVTVDAPGRWAMHCHLLLHMEMGMFRVVEVPYPGEGA